MKTKHIPKKQKVDGILIINNKKHTFFYAFIGCLAAISLSVFIIGISYYQRDKQELKDMEHLLNTIHAYIVTATDEEYNEIVSKVRNDLILHTSDNKLQKYIDLIPNTASPCCLDTNNTLPQLYLLALNHGTLYPLKIWEDNELQTKKQGYINLHSGYDELNEASIQIISMPDSKRVTATIEKGHSIISIQRMKKVFCNECISNILNANEASQIPQFIIFDANSHTFYPLKENCDYQLKNCTTEIKQLGEQSYQLNIIYTDST